MAIFMEQVKGIEPSYSAWEADVLPLNYTCNSIDFGIIACTPRFGKVFFVDPFKTIRLLPQKFTKNLAIVFKA